MTPRPEGRVSCHPATVSRERFPVKPLTTAYTAVPPTSPTFTKTGARDEGQTLPHGRPANPHSLSSPQRCDFPKGGFCGSSDLIQSTCRHSHRRSVLRTIGERQTQARRRSGRRQVPHRCLEPVAPCPWPTGGQLSGRLILDELLTCPASGREQSWMFVRKASAEGKGHDICTAL